MLDSERDRIFGEWLAAHKGVLFKVLHAHGFTHADREDLFQEAGWRPQVPFGGGDGYRPSCQTKPRLRRM